jgi:nifR3 family TIM-barrel protein
MKMVFKGFLAKIKKPIIGLAPMDGITDASFRHMVCKYGKPSFVVTEFVNVEGLARGAKKMLPAFLYSKIDRPIIAQLFGVEPISFYKCAIFLCALGFDGIDINMGCPVRKVESKGGGAGLIKNPKLAVEIIRAVKKGVDDWVNGISLNDAGVHENIIGEAIAKGMMKKNIGMSNRLLIPVSVKTRTGCNKVIAEDWVKILLEEKPAMIAMHGRTLKQLYSGCADWEVLAKAGRVVKESGIGTLFLGNGDIKSIREAKEKIREYGVDGVLVGRAVFGNPWFFTGKEPTIHERIKVLNEHLEYFERLECFHFDKIKKHFSWYFKGFDGAKKFRIELLMTKNPAEAKKVIKEAVVLCRL